MRDIESELLTQKQPAGSASSMDPEFQAMSSPTHHQKEKLFHALSIQPEVASSGNAEKMGLLSSCGFLCRTICQLISALVGVSLSPCVLVPLVLVFCLLLISGLVIASIAVIPLLCISVLVARLLQFMTRGEYYINIFAFKLAVRTALSVDLVFFLIFVGVFFPIAEYIPSLKHTIFAGLPLANWVIITCLMCALYIINFFLYLGIAFLLRDLLSAEPIGWDRVELGEAVSDVISGLFFCWAISELRDRVPAFEHHRLLDFPAYKWIQVSTFVFIGCNIIRVCTMAAPWLLWKAYRKVNLEPSSDFFYSTLKRLLCKHYLVFCASRLRRRINFLLSSLLLLLTWVLFFRSHLKSTPALDFYATWTFLSLFVCSLLWLVKSCVLLAVEINTVYNRLRYKIVDAGHQLYFLIVLDYGKHNADNEPVINRLKEYLLMHEAHPQCTPTMYDIYMVAYFFLRYKFDLSKEAYISGIISKLKSDYENGDFRNVSIEEYLKQLIGDKNSPNDVSQDSSGSPRGENSDNARQRSSRSSGREEKRKDDWEYFRELVKNTSLITRRRRSNRSSVMKEAHNCQDTHNLNSDDMDLSQVIDFDKVRMWMEKAHHSCLFLANTLKSAEEVVDCLNKIMSALLIGASILMWLLLTGLASTKVLVLIASPLLAATFIFGETCKTLFQGIIFVYVTHPFDVGDLCIIDDQMMEVKAIGVWITTFSKVSSQGEVIYPNAELAKKVVINHRTQFNWDDYVEFNLGPLEQEKIDILKQHIEEHFMQEGDIFIPNAHSITMMESGDQNTKITVRFKHNMMHTSEDWTYSECLWHKEKARYEFARHVKNLIKDLKKEEDLTERKPPAAQPP